MTRSRPAAASMTSGPAGPTAAVLAVLAACSPAPIASCDEDLAGVWQDDEGHRWMLLDRGRTLEAYPLFDDGKPPAPDDVIATPRAIDLRRDSEAPGGQVRRAFMRGGDRCVATARVALTSCRGATLELVMADPTPPIAFAPCADGTSPPSRRVRWTAAR